MDEQLRWLDGLPQSDLVRARKASPAEVETAARERIRRLDPELNALVWDAGPVGAPVGAHAMIVPAGWDSFGLPLAVAFSGRPGDDARLLALAAQIGAANSSARASPC
ncbi:UNVERIFIED_ORG: Asp-tRNA(Asn)/Glu-tRNA(Gln) amidotransferase A subunit family amidase [Arthrobacter sp. UYCu721]